MRDLEENTKEIKEAMEFIREARREALDAIGRALENRPPVDKAMQAKVKETMRIRRATDKKIARYWDLNPYKVKEE